MLLDQLDTDHGLHGLIYSLIGILAVNILAHVVKGVWTYTRRNMGPSKDQFRELIRALDETKEALDSQKLIVEKMALDIRRIYLFLKVIAGSKWPSYRKQVEEIEENLN